MDLNQAVSVNQASERLRVSPDHVRELIRSGRLRAAKVGRAVLVDLGSIDHRNQVVRPRPGRPLSPRLAWALLWHAGGDRPVWVNPVELGRVRRYLRRDPSEWPRLLAGRADVHSVRMLPGQLRRLRESGRACDSGISAAAHHHVDLVPAGDEAELYISADVFDELCASRRINLDPVRPNVVLRVPRFAHESLDLGQVAPAAVVAADLLESGDDRSADAGRQLLERLERERA